MAAPSDAAAAAAAAAPEEELPPPPPAEDGDLPSTSSSSSEDDDDEGFKGDGKKRRANAKRSTKPRPPPALRWMRTPLDNPDLGTSSTATATNTPASVPLSRVLGLDPRITAHLREKLGFGSLLPVQAAVWAAAAGGRPGAAHDLAVAAPTGSGKTLAYGLPLLHSLLDEVAAEAEEKGGENGGEAESKQPRKRLRRRLRRLGSSLGALVVVPTRDLAEQVAAVLGPAGAAVGLRTALIVGGAGGGSGGGGGGGKATATVTARAAKSSSSDLHYFHPPSFAEEALALVGKGSALRRGWCGDYASPALVPAEKEGAFSTSSSSAFDVVVATPGRLAAHLTSLGPSLSRKALRGLRFLVVDEADRLLRQEYGGWAAALGNAAPAVGGSGSGRSGGGGGNVDGEEMNAFSALLSASRRRCVRLAASATLTRDPAKLARLRLWRPRFVAVGGGGWDRAEEGEEEGREKEQKVGAAASDDEDENEEDGDDEEEEEGDQKPKPQPQPQQQKSAARFVLPPGLSLRRVDVGSRGGANKPAALLALLRSLCSKGQRSVVFCSSVAGARSVARFLGSVEPPLRIAKEEREGEGGEGGEEEEETEPKRVAVGLMASNTTTPAERQAALRSFADFSLPVLVCSDGATRGLDLGAGGRTAVVSYDPPAHAKALVHRAGRAVRGQGGGGGGGGGGRSGGAEKESDDGDCGDGDSKDKGTKPPSSSNDAAVIGTAYTLLRPQDAAFHKELLRKVAGEAALAGEGEGGGGGGGEEKLFSRAAAEQLLKAFKIPKAALREARKEAEAAVVRLEAGTAAGGAGKEDL